MANRNFKKVQSLNNETKIIAGRFATTAAGAATKLAGLGWSVTREDAGEYIVQLEDRYPTLISAIAQSSAETAFVEVEDVSGAGQITINTQSTDADGIVEFIFILNNSTVA